MSARLESLLDADRRAECLRNDEAMRTVTHAELQQCCNHNCRQGRDCPERAEADPMESSTIRWLAALLAVIAICAAAERLGLPLEWPL